MESGLPTEEIRIAAVAFSFLLAWLTYWILESKIRYYPKPGKPEPKRVK
jgi:peptidoglycan/LPS O-acetylase OafA/YrhL